MLVVFMPTAVLQMTLLDTLGDIVRRETVTASLMIGVLTRVPVLMHLLVPFANLCIANSRCGLLPYNLSLEIGWNELEQTMNSQIR